MMKCYLFLFNAVLLKITEAIIKLTLQERLLFLLCVKSGSVIHFSELVRYK